MGGSTLRSFAPPQPAGTVLASLLKGAPQIVFSNQTTLPLGPIAAVDCRTFNAVSVQVFITGTTPSVTLVGQGAAHENGTFLLLADPNASSGALTTSTDFDVIVGEAYFRPNITAISGTFAPGQGVTVIVTPFVMPGQPKVTIGAVNVTASQNLAQVAGVAISEGQKAMASSLPVVIASDQAPGPGAGQQANAQLAPTAVAATAVIARSTRTSVTFVNNGTMTVYLGAATVTSANGVALPVGASRTLTFTGLIQMITASGTGAIDVWDEFV